MSESTADPWSSRITAGRAFAAVLLVALIVLPCVAGPASAYVALLAAVAGALVMGNREGFRTALADPGLWLFPIAFVLLVVALAASARAPEDLLALFDFAALLIAIPAFVLLVRFAAPNNAVLVSWLALAGSFAAVLMGLFEGFVFEAERARGNSSSIFFSDLSLWLGFLALTGFFAPPTRWRWLLALGPVFGTAAAVMGGTRGALLVAGALVVVVIVFVLFSSIARRRQKLGAALLVLLATAGVASVFLETDRLVALPGLLQQVIEGGESSDHSINLRIAFYEGGVAAVADAPLVGHGWWRRFEAAAAHMPPGAAQQGTGDRNAHLHNDILNFGAGAGLVGIAAYVLILAAPLAGAWFSHRDGQRGARLYAASTLIFGFLAMGITDSMFVYELPKTVFCLASAVVLALCRDGGPTERSLPLVTRGFGAAAKTLAPLPSWTILVALLVIPALVGTLSSVIAVAAALAVAAPVLARSGAWDDIRRQPAMVAFAASFLVLTASFIVTADHPADVRFALNFLALPLATVVYLLARERPADDPASLLALCLLGTAAATALAIAAVTVLGLPRAQGIFGGPNLFPRVVIPLGFMAMGGALLVPGRARLIFYLGPILAIVAALLAASRGAALALPPLVLIAAAALAWRAETRRDLIGLAALAMIAAGAVWLLAPGDTARLLSTLPSIADVLGGEASADFATWERQAMLSAGWAAFLEAPFLGYGWANLGTAAALANPEGFGHLVDQPFMFHNDALDFAVAGGVVGIAVWLVLLAAPVVGAVAMRGDPLRLFRLYGALVLSVSFLVFGLTDLTLGYDLTTTLYAFLTALVLGVRAPR